MISPLPHSVHYIQLLLFHPRSPSSNRSLSCRRLSSITYYYLFKFLAAKIDSIQSHSRRRLIIIIAGYPQMQFKESFTAEIMAI